MSDSRSYRPYTGPPPPLPPSRSTLERTALAVFSDSEVQLLSQLPSGLLRRMAQAACVMACTPWPEA